MFSCIKQLKAIILLFLFQIKKDTQLHVSFFGNIFKQCCRFFGAEDRNRTGTEISLRGILSPLRLPVPPPRQKVEATPRIELGIKVLQTSALPLGYVALTGAENEIRTRDPLLGKEVLYH